MAAEGLDRINVKNNPVNFIDPLGLLTQFERQTIIRNWTAAGSAIGAMLGFLGGGGAGLLTGPGAPAAVPAGAYAGAAGGAVGGGATGAVIGNFIANLMEGSDDSSDPCDEDGTLQSRGNTINKRTADYFGKDRREVGRALEALKRENGLRNDFHETRIMKSGDVINKNTNQVIDNLWNYMY